MARSSKKKTSAKHRQEAHIIANYLADVCNAANWDIAIPTDPDGKVRYVVLGETLVIEKVMSILGAKRVSSKLPKK